MAPTFKQMRRRARVHHIRVLEGWRFWMRPQLRRAADTLTRWGAFNGNRPTETGERLLAALRAEGKAA